MDAGEKRLYVLDESSLASTRQVHKFLNRLHPGDRVLLVGDRRQGAKDLLNSRMAYVSLSRGRYDAQIYTNNTPTLGQELSRVDVRRLAQSEPNH